MHKKERQVFWVFQRKILLEIYYINYKFNVFYQVFKPKLFLAVSVAVFGLSVIYAFCFGPPPKTTNLGIKSI